MKNIRELVLLTDNLLVNKLPDGQLEVRTVIWDEDGDPIYHRHVLHPGQNLVDQNPQVKRIAESIHTPSVIVEWEAAEAARRADERVSDEA